MRILVCGGRDLDERDVADHLKFLLKDKQVDCIIEGEAKGADRGARLYAEEEGIAVERYPADWERFGKAAGRIRNREMLDHGEVDFAIVFPGGNGTDLMLSLLEGIKKIGIHKVEYDKRE